MEPRFREAIDEDEEHLGPGSYLSQNIIEKFQVQKPSSEMVASVEFWGVKCIPACSAHLAQFT